MTESPEVGKKDLFRINSSSLSDFPFSFHPQKKQFITESVEYAGGRN